MRRLVGAVLFFVVLAWGPSAHACSCVQRVLSRVVSPADKQVGVGTDAAVRLFLSGFEPEFRQLVTSEVRLRHAGGALVNATAKVESTRIDLVPKTPLKPNSRYVVEQLVAYDQTGARISDTQRWHHARGYGTAVKQVHLAWFATSSFTTGSGKSSSPKVTATVRSAKVFHSSNGGMCGPGHSLRVKFDPLDVPFDSTLELEVRGQGVVATLPPGTYDAVGASNMLCAYDKVWIKVGAGAIKARVVVRGPSAKRTSSAWATAVGKTGSVPARTPLAPAVVKRWKAATLVSKPQRIEPKLLHCTHGLETWPLQVVVGGGGAASYADIGSVGKMAGRFATVYDGKNDQPVLHAMGSPPNGLSFKGTSPRGWFDSAGAIVAATHWPASGGSEVTVSRVDRKGGPRWTRRISAKSPSKPRVIAHGGAALLTWERESQPTYHSDLCWMTLNDNNGKRLTSSHSACIPTTEGYAGLEHVGGYHMIAHHRRAPGSMGGPGVAELWVGKKGPTKRLPLAIGTSRGGLDMAPVAQKEVGIVGTKGSSIVWVKVAPDGKHYEGPVVVSHGDRNRKPRVTFGHGVFAVAWERSPGRSVHAAVVDRFGSVSPITKLFAGVQASTVAITPTKTGFLATATRDDGAVLSQALACRKQPPKGPPDRLRLP